MSFQIFTGNIAAEEVLNMLQQLTPDSYAISTLPAHTIKDYARQYGFKVSCRTINYRVVKVKLALGTLPERGTE